MKGQLKQGILYLSLLCCTFTACNDDEDTITKNVLDVNTEAVMFTEKNSTKKVIIIAEQEWTAEVPKDANWCTVKQSGDELEITVKENTEVQTRTTVLTIQSQGQKKLVSVKQAGTAPHISITLKDGQEGAELKDKGLKLDGSVRTCRLKILATVDYELITEENVNWIKVGSDISTAAEEEESILLLELQPNETGTSRRTEVLFKQTEGDYYTYLSIVQAAQ